MLTVAAFSAPARATGMIKGTLHGVRRVSEALKQYELREEQLPPITDRGWICSEPLSEYYYAPSLTTNNASGFIADWWGEALICRHPGRYGHYDVYSTGANRSDDGGTGDDLASWGGVNEGYYYKRYWPSARRWTTGSATVSVVALMIFVTRRRRAWPAVLVWVAGTLWGARNVDIFGSTASEPAPVDIVLSIAAAILAACMVASALLIKGVRSVIRNRRHAM